MCVLGYTALFRKIRVVLGLRCCLSLLCDLFNIDLLKLDDLLGVLCCWPSAPANPSGRWDEVLVHESEDAITDLLEFSFHFRDVFPRVRCLLLVVLLSLLCAIYSSLSATSAAD